LRSERSKVKAAQLESGRSCSAGVGTYANRTGSGHVYHWLTVHVCRL